MSRLDPKESFSALKQNVQDSIKRTFPQVGEKHTLDIEDVEIPDIQSSADYTSQKKAKMNGRTWGVPVKATLVLKDNNTGKVIDRKTRKIATLPKVTNRYSYIVDGTEFQVDGQWRLRPGVYTKVKENGELDSFFNVKGRPLHMGFDPKDRKFKVQLGGSNPPLYPIMKAMGVSDDTLERQWGKEILEANRLDTRGKPVKVDRVAIDFAKRLNPKAEVENYEQAAAVIQENLHNTELHPEVTKRTLGKPIDKINSDALLLSSGRLLGVARGKESPDVRDSLMYKDFYGVEDYVAERIDGHKRTIDRRIGNNLDRKDRIDDIVGPDVYNRPIKEFFGKVSLANAPSQTNPLKMISSQMKTTIAGEGGVADANRITEDAKLVDPSHFGVLDPLNTPEGGSTGVSLQLALGARKVGNRVALPLIDVKTGKTKLVGTTEVHDSVVALPDSVKRVGNKFVPKSGTKVLASTAGNEMRPVSMKEVKYVVPKNSQMFSLATNMVPFINSDSPNRATMAGRHMEQAIPLVESEPPLVQSMLGEKSFDELVGGFASHHSPVEGKVAKITSDAITVQQGKKKVDIPIYNNYPLNDKKGVLHSKPLVKEGDTIKKGQLIADSNYTEGGVYAPGRNLKVALTPWKGLNFEDGVVISETASKKLTSEHLYKKGLSTRDATLEGKKKYQAYYPDRLNKEQAEKLDDDGVIRVGMKVKPGDTLVAALADQQLTTEQQKMQLLHKSLVKPKKDKAITWDEDYEGEVVEVNRQSKNVAVHIRTAEPMEIGDKLSDRHAAKGIVTGILPDHEMPRTQDGEPVEVLLNPIGIAGRMNVGQVLEVAAGKVADKRGTTFKVENFTNDDNLEMVAKELKKEGISDKEDLIDPTTGSIIPGIQTGKKYIFKLEHQVGKKMAARDRDAYDHNLVPRGGGKHGGMAMGTLGNYALLAHGARENLREMQTTKCFSWSTPVLTEEGPMPIGKIVNQKLDVRVLSYNQETKCPEFRPILNHWKREMDETPMVEVTFHSPDPSGVLKRRHVYCTHEHEFYVEGGEKVHAKSLKGRRILVPASMPSIAQRETLLGSLPGDGCLQVHNSPSPVFQIEDAPCGAALQDVLSICRAEEAFYPSLVEGVRFKRPGVREGRFLYNLEVDTNHNYVAGGALVGNSDKAQGGEKDELWGALQAGELLPPPKTTFAYQKFNSYLSALGVDTRKDGNSLQLVPITDKDVLAMSNGEIKDGGRILKMSNLKPEKNGLFDEEITGGMDGKKFAHIKIDQPMPNPLFEKAIMSLSGIRGPQFGRLIDGDEGVDKNGNIVPSGTSGAVYGPSSIGRLLEKVDVERDLKEEEERIKGLKGQAQNESRKKIKYLRALRKINMSPTDAYMMQNVPVLPPSMRPISVMEDGSLQTDDVNELYKSLALVNRQHKSFPTGTPQSVKAPVAASIYDHMKALTGLGGTLNSKHPGILQIIAGKEGPKSSFVQSVLLKRKQDMTARSTIVPEPTLNLDEAAIPRKAAKEMYKPFIVRELRRTAGATPLQAKKMIEEDDPLAKKALDRVVNERPLLLKRDPVLHKYGIQAFKPRLVEGKAIKIHPLVCSGFNADFDGDTMSAFVPVSQESIKEAYKMFPSNNLFSPSTHNVSYTPTHEQQVGLFMASQVGKKTNRTFKDKEELERAFNANEVGLTDVVKVGGVRTTLGRVRIDSQLPGKLQGGKVLTDLNYNLTKKEQGKLFQLMAEVDKKTYPEAINKLKDIGNETASKEGFSFGVEDFRVHRDIRDPILLQAASKTAKLDPKKPADAQKIVDVYGDAMEKMESKLQDRAKQQKTQLDRLQVAAGIKGNGYRQLTAAPVLFVDGKGEVVPNPVGKSYSEGLDAASYWSATSGGRKGIIQKVQSVSEPGYLTKMMTNSVIDTVVDTDDCETDRGINLSVDEPDAVGRYTTADLKLGRGKTIPSGTLLTPDLLTKAKNNKINKVTVRSPMRCNHPKGICAKCAGLNESGQLPDKGTNLGVMAAQALGERGTQLALKSFHSGGVYEGKESAKSLTAGGLDRATSLLYLQKKVKGSAVLAPTGGKIRRRKKDPAGGYRVMIGDTEVYVPANRKLLSKINPGTSVKKGEPLTSGPVNPHELLPLAGMSKVQGHLASELHGIYGQYGVRRRNSEIMVRALSNVTKVEDPGGNPDLLPGDFASTTQVYDWNRKNKQSSPVKHTPVLRGVRQIPLDVQEDWMARLNHEHLRSTMIEAAQQGWSTDLHGLNPIPPLIHGAEFGKGTEDKPWRY